MNFQELLVEFGVLVGSVWIATEGLGVVTKRIGLDRALLNVILGTAAGPIAYGVGWVNTGEGVSGWIASIFLGLIASGISAVGHDKLVKPVTSTMAGDPK